MWENASSKYKDIPIYQIHLKKQKKNFKYFQVKINIENVFMESFRKLSFYGYFLFFNKKLFYRNF